MKAIQQIAGRIEALQAGLAGNERVDVFDGAAALGRNLNGGTLPGGVTEIPMTPAEWALYSPPCEVEPGGGLVIRVPGVYLTRAKIRYPVGAGASTVTLGVSYGLPVYTLLDTAAVAAAADDYWQSSFLLTRFNAGTVIRLCARASAAISWQWAYFGVSLLGMVG